MLAGLGIVGGLWNKRSRGGAVFLLGLLFSSALALSAGFYFREHYFIFILPAVSLLCGLAISTLSDFVASRSRLVGFIPVLVFCIALSLADSRQKDNSTLKSLPAEASRMTYRIESVSRSPFGLQNTLRDHYQPQRYDCHSRLRAADLFLFRATLRHRIHLHLRAYGGAEATRDRCRKK